MEADRKNMDALLRDLESCRLDLRTKSETVDQLKFEAASRDEELKLLRRSHEMCVELKEALRREENDKTAMSVKLEQVTEALSTAREALSKQQVGLTAADMEYQRATRDAVEFRQRANAVEDVSRENERMRVKLDSAKTDIQDLTHRLSNMARDLTEAQSETAAKQTALATLKQDLALLSSQKQEIERSRDELSTAFHTEATRCSVLESSLAESRASLDAVNKELASERTARLTAERDSRDGHDVVRGIREEVGRACVMSMDAMKRWDGVISSVLDGNYFDSIISAGL
jgi:chromosome segregation ATPase